MTDFEAAVYAAVQKIPYGTVATYGQIAKAVGAPRGARAVGNALHHHPDGDGTPCYRVVNAQGRLAPFYVFGGLDAQRDRLISEGIRVRNYRVDLEEYRCNDYDLADK